MSIFSCTLIDHPTRYQFTNIFDGPGLSENSTIADLVSAVIIHHSDYCGCTRDVVRPIRKCRVFDDELPVVFTPFGDELADDVLLRDCCVPDFILDSKEVDETQGTHSVIEFEDAHVVRRLGGVTRLPGDGRRAYSSLSSPRGILVVDKTRFLHRLVNPSLTAMMRPRGSGVSTLLSVVKTYLDRSNIRQHERVYFAPQEMHSVPARSTWAVTLNLTDMQDELAHGRYDRHICKGYLDQKAAVLLECHSVVLQPSATWDTLLELADAAGHNVFVCIDGSSFGSTDVSTELGEAIQKYIIDRVAADFKRGLVYGALLICNAPSCPHDLELDFSEWDLTVDPKLHTVCGVTVAETAALGMAANIELLHHINDLAPLDIPSAGVNVYRTSDVLKLGHELVAGSHICTPIPPVVECPMCARDGEHEEWRDSHYVKFMECVNQAEHDTAEEAPTFEAEDEDPLNRVNVESIQRMAEMAMRHAEMDRKFKELYANLDRALLSNDWSFFTEPGRTHGVNQESVQENKHKAVESSETVHATHLIGGSTSSHGSEIDEDLMEGISLDTYLRLTR